LEQTNDSLTKNLHYLHEELLKSRTLVTALESSEKSLVEKLSLVESQLSAQSVHLEQLERHYTLQCTLQHQYLHDLDHNALIASLRHRQQVLEHTLARMHKTLARLSLAYVHQKQTYLKSLELLNK
jgi:hypothetical protein